MDAKDILGLPKTPLPLPQEKKSRPQKDSQRKPDGISREVYALTGGLAPLMPSIDVAQLKRRTQSENEKITWQWLPFSNSARKDSLQLYHWVRVVNAVPPTGDYSFAKYNKSVDIVKYTDEEYEKHLTDPMWTKEETDQLFDLCERFDLRFVVIADRFPSSRTVEQLKDRYYSASRAILISRASSPGDVSGHPIVKFFPLCRNHTMFHKRLSASAHYPWSFLKQNSKSARMLRFLLKQRKYLSHAWLQEVLKSQNCQSHQMLVQKVLKGLLFLLIPHHLLPVFSLLLQMLHLQLQ
ncbi:hypothetical protein CsSME_00043565 [Camellia sinensis var. sinensis]